MSPQNTPLFPPKSFLSPKRGGEIGVTPSKDGEGKSKPRAPLCKEKKVGFWERGKGQGIP